MHELGVLCHVVKKVNDIAERNHIQSIKYITLEVGEDSTFVPVFLKKLFPIAIENSTILKNAEMKIEMVQGESLIIKNIGY